MVESPRSRCFAKGRENNGLELTIGKREDGQVGLPFERTDISKGHLGFGYGKKLKREDD